jgi:hypothetical protein
MLTNRFAEALAYAEKLHRDQRRKGNDIPYVAHLMAVTATVLEWGGDEDTAIAALLHDSVEDQGGDATADIIRSRFGDRVVDLVLHCTDSATVDPEAKLPNITATIRDVRAHGPQTLERFNKPELVVWYFRSVAQALAPHAERAPVAELNAAVDTLAGLLAPKAEA